jgi:hypothetical protein
MIVTTVTVYVKPENIEDFIEASTENHESSIKEPGNMRFDVLQSMSDPTRFLLYEACQRTLARNRPYTFWENILRAILPRIYNLKSLAKL